MGYRGIALQLATQWKSHAMSRKEGRAQEGDVKEVLGTERWRWNLGVDQGQLSMISSLDPAPMKNLMCIALEWDTFDGTSNFR